MRRKSETPHQDVMIAATAAVHGLTLVTRDVADFAASDASVFHPFAPVQLH